MVEYLNRLEEKIAKLTGLHASIREERDSLTKENTDLRKRLEELETENRSLKGSQEEVRSRVDALIKRIEGLGE